MAGAPKAFLYASQSSLRFHLWRTFKNEIVALSCCWRVVDMGTSGTQELDRGGQVGIRGIDEEDGLGHTVALMFWL
jgi:hypothetical protein